MNPHPLNKIFKDGLAEEIKNCNKYFRDRKQRDLKTVKLWSKTIDTYSGYFTYDNDFSDDDSSDDDN